MGILGHPDHSDNWRYIVTFSLDEQTYAIPIESVVKIMELAAMTSSPQPRSDVVGWIQLENQRIPVVNMRRHQGMTEMALEPHMPVIVVQINETTLALIVDKLSGAVRVPTAQFTRSTERLPGTTIQTSHGSTLLVNPTNLFSPEQMKSFSKIQS